ncbi:hypothetical protein O3M35_006795 [Rhynocoris fuscipes]|uniref:CMP/dCMP-type deaminase domain-containing protein n=1 Tax=Rhynocoris fuscipes TaxID=488301 RepID=A0AAW1DKP4_9HEMI
MSMRTDANDTYAINKVIFQKETELLDKLLEIDYGPKVDYIYNPIVYASQVHNDYLTKYCNGPKDILFLGMNPGPWGMMQNGVPFGECISVRDFLQLTGTVDKPSREHPSKPVLGLACNRSEVSGKRFWELANVLGGGSAELFFKNAFVYNYFPLGLLNSNGKNITPPELKADVQKKIEQLCDETLSDILCLLQVKIIVGIGRFAEKRAKNVCTEKQHACKVVFISHPSPRNPASNRDWLSATKRLIIDYNLAHYFSIDKEYWMKEALAHAEQALKEGEVPVGCLFIKDNKIIAVGSNDVNRTRNATRHAEMICIDTVLNSESAEVFADISVIVTVEPCIMCASALHDLRVRQILYGCPNDRFGGCGSVFDVASVHKRPVPVIGGIHSDHAMNLLKTFYKGVNPNAPPNKVKTKNKDSSHSS